MYIVCVLIGKIKQKDDLREIFKVWQYAKCVKWRAEQ